MSSLVCVILGPTASGKSSLAVKAAKQLGGEIVSADSMQLYRGMDIGTAKVRPDEMDGVPHHMIDVCDPDTNYTVANYQKDAFACIDDILAKGKLPIVVGGSGLHINSITHELDMSSTKPSDSFREQMAQLSSEQLYTMLEEADPLAAARVHPHNRPRLIRALEIATSQGSRPEYDFEQQSSKYDFVIFGLNLQREKLYERINERVDEMFELGLVDEVRLLSQQFAHSRVLTQAIGYKEVLSYLRDEISLNEAMELIKRGTRRFAKRQLTWFKRDDRIDWLDAQNPQKALEHIIRKVEQANAHAAIPGATV